MVVAWKPEQGRTDHSNCRTSSCVAVFLSHWNKPKNSDTMMTTRYATLLLTIFLAFGAQAQGVVTVRNSQGQVVNGTLVTTSAAQSTDTVKLLSRLTGDVARQINVRRYELWTVPNTQNFYCWGVCYLPVASGVNPTWISQHYVDMNPNATYNNFAAYHEANGQATSTARFRYVWFDTADPYGADSSWVDIEFGGTVGLAERSTKAAQLSAWPNPSNGEDVSLDYALDSFVPGSAVVLYTVLGERIRAIELPGAQGRVVLGTSDLGSGVYFANVERNGRVLATRRVVITR